MKVTIIETVEYVLEATTPERAEERFLAMTPEGRALTMVAVIDREVMELD